MITALQILFVLLLLIIIIHFVFKPRRKRSIWWPANYRDLLLDYCVFYEQLDDEGKKSFEEKFEKFLSSVSITGANADVEDLDRVLIGAAAVIPVFYIRDWEYVHLREVLLYPGNFNVDFEQSGNERMISGMVGTGYMQHVMILNKWDLRQGFINSGSNRNTAIHEFVHLVDKMDGTLDGVPELLLERKYVERWKDLLHVEMDRIRQGLSDIDAYGATSLVECFAVISEYFFEQPEQFKVFHPELNTMMERIFLRKG